MLRKEIISNKSFKRTSVRFKNSVDKYILNLYDDHAVKDRFDFLTIFLVESSIMKLVKNHKAKPFKRKSAYTEKIPVFVNSDNIINFIRVSYELHEDKLIFKFLTKTKSRFKRKVQFILPINEKCK